MSNSLKLDQSERPHIPMPRLSYRNPVPKLQQTDHDHEQNDDESEDEEKTSSTTAAPGSRSTSTENVPGRSITEIRQGIADFHLSPVSPQSPQYTTSGAPISKSKRSIFGGMFQKEPTLSAVESYGQSMKAQHGSLSPKNIPNVSAERMPSNVPKVNSRWDGVPDSVRMREEEDRERAKAQKRRSKIGSSSTRGIDFYEETLPGQRRNSNAVSAVDSWVSNSTNSRPYFQDNMSMRPESIYSTSSGGSGPSATRPTWEKAYSYTSSTGPKSSDNSLRHYKDTASTPKGLYGLQSTQSVSTQCSNYSDQSRANVTSNTMAATKDTIPDYTLSPVTTPLERSPQTPSPYSEDGPGVDSFLHSGTKACTASSGRGHTSKPSTSKRVPQAGLGLRAGSTIAPWEAQLPPTTRSNDPQSKSTPMSPRGTSRLFGRDKK